MKFLNRKLILSLFLCSIAGYALGSLNDVLYTYETLHSKDFGHKIVKRSLHTDTPNVRQVEFTTFGRHFKLLLQSRRGLLSSHFKAFSVNEAGEERQIYVDEENFYKGYVTDEPQSEVHAYWEDETITATIKVPQDTYIIEPSWRHLPKSENYSLVSYRGSDLKKKYDTNHPDHKGDHFCGFVRPEGGEMVEPANTTEEELKNNEEEGAKDPRRKKRQAPKNTCPLLLVADYKFFENVGQKRLSVTTNYLIGLIDRVDAIYRSTNFDYGYSGYGFEIKEIKVHEAPTKVKKGEEHYNMYKEAAWPTRPLLEHFSRQKRNRHFCLAHLFTYQSFEGGVLGLAYIGSQRKYSVGGICTQVYWKNGQNLYLNTGWSSSQNSYGQRILTQEADLVTTHEFGHNWGSEHDPDSAQCAPSSFDNGKFIMYTYSVSGYEANNKLFSPCSRLAIGTVLRSKSPVCFREPSEAFCGNSLVEKDEECDGGPLGKKGEDPCCTETCQLRSGAKCSDKNSVCCLNCDFAPPNTICKEEPEYGTSCEGAAKCTGNSIDCPKPEKIKNNTPCFDNGTCMEGVCKPFCEMKKLISCICDQVGSSCKRCCRYPGTGVCVPYQTVPGDTLDLQDGKPCIQGFCEKGACKKQVQDLVQRFWSIIEDITPDKLVEFMKANIVGTVILFSLIFWIPISCGISYYDKKKLKEEKQILDWHRSDNPNLTLEADRSRVRPASATRRRPGPVGSVIRKADVAAAIGGNFSPVPENTAITSHTTVV